MTLKQIEQQYDVEAASNGHSNEQPKVMTCCEEDKERLARGYGLFIFYEHTGLTYFRARMEARERGLETKYAY